MNAEACTAGDEGSLKQPNSPRVTVTYSLVNRWARGRRCGLVVGVLGVLEDGRCVPSTHTRGLSAYGNPTREGLMLFLLASEGTYT